MPAHAAKEPDGLGVGKSAHPFAVTVEAKVPVRPSLISPARLQYTDTNGAECDRPRRLWD
jgi:hypothetical protein